jgi:hypothetical protein
MERNIPRDFLVAMMMDPSSERRRLAPNWAASALLYGRPEYVTEGSQDEWPPADAPAWPNAGERAPLDQGGWSPLAKQSQNSPRTRPDIGMARAALVGALQGGSAEFGDELAGGYAAGSLSGVNARRPVGMALQSILGLARLGYETLRGQRGSATEAYERGRDQVRADTETARQQYPGTYYTANIGAGFAVPMGRAAQVATLPVRMRRGAVAGGLFGGLSGVGSGETATDRAIQGAIGAGIGGATGAGVSAIAPAVVNGLTRAGRAAYRGVVGGNDAVSPMVTGARNGPRVRTSRGPGLYDPPDLPQRPFPRDYPHGARVDAEGRLAHDMEGRPLHARFVFGRRTNEGSDVGLQPGDHDRLAVAMVRKPATDEFPERMRGAWGEIGFDPIGYPDYIWLRRGMHPLQRARAYAHELAHGIDDVAYQLPTNGLMDELRPLYNTLNNPRRTPDGVHAAPGAIFTPRDRGYSDGDVAREYAAEAIRAYMTNPNYIKSVAPRTAAAIRDLVNAHSRLSDMVQFNSLLAAPAATGLALSSRQTEPGP